MISIKWKKLLILFTMWLSCELVLNFVGYDDLADCGEYIFDKSYIVFIR